MDPLNSSIIKSIEIVLFYPIHSIIYNQQIKQDVKYKTFSRFYKGLPFQFMYQPINRYLDVIIYNKYDVSLQTSILNSTLKFVTYPLQTCEVYYQINNKLPNIINYYNGYQFFFISNTISYYLWFNSLKYYDLYFTNIINNTNVKNATVGFLAGLTVDIIINPLKVLKTNYQNNIKKYDFNFKFMFRGIKARILLSSLQSAFFYTAIKL